MGNISWSNQPWYQQEISIAKSNGIPTAIVDAVIQMESGGVSQTNSIGAAGLLQLLPNGGQGSGYSNSQLMDPVTNLQIGIPYLSNAYKASPAFDNSYNWWYNFGIKSGHVGVPGSEQAAAATAMQQAYNNNGGGGGSNSGNTDNTAAAQKVVAWFKSFIQTKTFNPPGESGVDLATPYHTPVPAMYGGKVLWAGNSDWGGSSSGGIVAISTMVNGVKDVFYAMHLDTVTVKAGDTVNIGDTIGLSGGQTSGGTMPTSPQYSTGPHTELGFNASNLLNSGNVKAGPLPGAGFDPRSALTDIAAIAKSSTGGGSNNPGGTNPAPTNPGGGNSIAGGMMTDALNSLMKSDFFQRATLIFIALGIILIGVLVLFFSNNGAQNTAKVVAATA